MFKNIEVNSSAQQILAQLASDTNLGVMAASISVDKEFISQRVVFTIRSNSKFSGWTIDNSKTVESVRNTIKLVGFQSQLDIVEGIADLIANDFNTVRYPIHGIGLSVQDSIIDQLKVYYLMRIYNQVSLKEDVMGKIDRELAIKTLSRIMEELGLHDDGDKLFSISSIMDRENYELEFIGINFEKGKTPGLKVYFRPVS